MHQRIVAGDTVEFRTSIPDYPASAGWTLKHILRPFTSGDPIELMATADGDDYSTTVAAVDTAAWAPGDYSLIAQVTNGSGDRLTLDPVAVAAGRLHSAIVTIVGDPAEGAAYDNRSHARKALAAIEAVLARRATKDQEEYQIEDRMLKRTPIGDLLRLRDYYRAEVAAEEAAAKLSAGGAARKIQVRF